MDARRSSVLLWISLKATGGAPLFAQASRLDVNAFGQAEVAHQTVAGGGAAAAGVSDQRRVRLGASLAETIPAAASGCSEALQVEQARALTGAELASSGSGIASEYWKGPRLGVDASVSAAAGRYLDSASAPISAVLGQNFSNTYTYYRRQGIAAGAAYTLTRLWEGFAHADLSHSDSAGTTIVGEGFVLGTKVRHSLMTTSTLQVGVRRDMPKGGDDLRTVSGSYRLDHALGRVGRLDATVGKDVASSRTGQVASNTYGGEWLQEDAERRFRLFAARNLSQRPITNEQTLVDTGGGEAAKTWTPERQVLAVTLSRVAERQVFGASAPAQTIDAARVEHSIGMVSRPGRGPGRDYDRLVLAIQIESARSALGAARRETFSIGYYLLF